MLEVFTQYRTYPQSLKKAVVALAAGWIWFFYCLYMAIETNITQEDYKLLGKFLIACLILLYFVMRIKKWARIMALMANIMMIVYTLTYSAHFFLVQKSFLGSIYAVNVAFFAFASYYLFIKETKAFFIAQNPPPEQTSGKEAS